MRTLNKVWGIGLLAICLSLASPKKTMAQDGYVSDQEFYDQLQPYGTWVSDPQYGNVWVPDADENFRPYASRGHWVVTDYGNTWVSDYPWGWATFHYGRWRYDDYYGWEWVPGHQWAPAWVSWRHGGGYYGWAPLMPGVSISISIGGGYRVPDSYWVCAPQAYIASPNIYNYYTPPSRSVTIIHNTTIINNTYVKNNVTYVSGPRVQEIRQVTHNNNVRIYNINNASAPGTARVSNNTVNIYRPAIQKSPTAHPARVVDAAAYKAQNPGAGIASHSTAGPGFNHRNALKLATVARSTTPDAKVVHVNQPNNSRPAVAQPNRPAATTPNQPQAQQKTRQQQAQQQVQQKQQAAQQTQRQGQQRLQQQKQQAQQQAQQKQQQVKQTQQQDQQRLQQQKQQQTQQAQQKQQQAQQVQQRQVQQQAQQKQQQAQQQAQQAQQRQQQQAQQQAQQKQQQAQQQAQQRQQQQAQQQAQQKQQAQQQQRQQQQAQQRQQQQAQQQTQQRKQAQQQQALQNSLFF